jgi:hypothetical protein
MQTSIAQPVARLPASPEQALAPRDLAPAVAPEPASAVPLEQLEREICELAAHLAAATCRWLMLVAAFDERGGWAEWGVKSCAHWLSWRCSIGLGAAREHVRVGRRLQELERVRAAFATGELSYCKVRAITRVATPEIEEELVELALHASGAQVEKLIRGYRGALAVSLATARATLDRRFLNWWWNDDGSLQFNGRLPPDDGALLLSALRAAEAAEVELAEHRHADALAALARSALAGGLESRASGDGCELVVHVDAEALAAEQTHAQAQLANGPALSPETVRRLGCDSSLVRIIERDGEPLSVGRRTRTIPPALRRALRARDRGCRFPGCAHERFLHAHHIHHWARGGETKLGNLVQLCSHHHRLVHEGGFRVESAGPAAFLFRRPDGSEIPPAPSCTSATGPAIEHQHPRPAPVIDAYTCMPRSAGDSIDYGIAVEGLLAKVLAAT